MFSIDMLFKLSEALEENLLLWYHPNIPAVPNPLEAKCAQLQAENEALKASLEKLNAVAEENVRLKAQLEILTEVMKGKAG